MMPATPGELPVISWIMMWTRSSRPTAILEPRTPSPGWRKAWANRCCFGDPGTIDHCPTGYAHGIPRAGCSPPVKCFSGSASPLPISRIPHWTHRSLRENSNGFYRPSVLSRILKSAHRPDRHRVPKASYRCLRRGGSPQTLGRSDCPRRHIGNWPRNGKD